MGRPPRTYTAKDKARYKAMARRFKRACAIAHVERGALKKDIAEALNITPSQFSRILAAEESMFYMMEVREGMILEAINKAGLADE